MRNSDRNSLYYSFFVMHLIQEYPLMSNICENVNNGIRNLIFELIKRRLTYLNNFMSVEILSSKFICRKLFQKCNVSYRYIKMFYNKLEIKETIHGKFRQRQKEPEIEKTILLHMLIKWFEFLSFQFSA